MWRKLILIFVVVGIGLLIYKIFFTNKPLQQEKQYNKYVVSKGDVINAVSVNGEIRPVKSIEVKSKASGKIIWFPKSEGDRVLKDELLVKIEKTNEERNCELARVNLKTAEAKLNLNEAEYERSLQQSEAQCEIAQEDYKSKKREFERLKSLSDSVIKQQEIDASELLLKQSEQNLKKAVAELEFVKKKHQHDKQLLEAEVEKSKISLQEAQERLRDTDVYSPIEGIILKRYVEEGQIISSGISTVGGGTALFILADVTSLIVDARVDEIQVGKVKINQESLISVDASVGKKFRGKVVFIPPQADLESNIPYYRVKIIIRDADLDILRVGMTANVNIVIDMIKDVLRLPVDAIKRDRQGPFVYLKKNGNYEKKYIAVGKEGSEFVEIKDEFSEGLEVYQEQRSQEMKFRRRVF